MIEPRDVIVFLDDDMLHYMCGLCDRTEYLPEARDISAQDAVDWGANHDCEER